MNSLTIILSKESEEVTSKVERILYDCLKQSTNTLKSKIFRKLLEFLKHSYKNIFNTKLSKNNLRQDSTSFKTIGDCSSICLQFLFVTSQQVFSINEDELQDFFDVLKRFLTNLIPPSPENGELIMEEYYSLLFRVMVQFLPSKTNQNERRQSEDERKSEESIFERRKTRLSNILSHSDLMKLIQYILLNTTGKETRKEVLNQIFKLDDDYLEIFFQKRNYFLNEQNLIKQNVVMTDVIYNDIMKFFIRFENKFFQRLSLDDKKESFRTFVNRINNFRLNYDVKADIFNYLEKTLEGLKTVIIKERSYELTNSLLKQITNFFNTLMTILFDLDGFFLKEERKTNKEILSKNMLEVDVNQNDKTKIEISNRIHLFEVLMHNEYEKYCMLEDTKTHLKKIFICTTNIMKILAEIFTSELVNENINNSYNDNNNNPKEIENKKRIQIHRKANDLSKLMYNFLLIYEKHIKQHRHNQKEDECDSDFINVYLKFPTRLCLTVFKISMPYIFQLLLQNAKVCPNANCIFDLLIDKIFSVEKENKHSNDLKKKLYYIYFNYFSSKIYDFGNNVEEYEPNYQLNGISMSFLITTMKQLFKLIKIYVVDEDIKSKLSTLLMNCIILSKNSMYFYHYIYVIRCLFKILKLDGKQNNTKQYEFHRENIHLIYAIMRYLLNIKEAFPTFKETITEIIIIFPLKFRFLLDFAHLFFPSLMDSLNLSQDIIIIGLGFLEHWLNFLLLRQEAIKPFLQKNLLQLTTFLTSHLYKHYNISLNSLKMLSKFGGQCRNYMEHKEINIKTNPTQVLVLNLKDRNEFEYMVQKKSKPSKGKGLDLLLDNIIDICVKIITKKNNNVPVPEPVRKSLAVLQACILSFFDKEINYSYLMNVKKSIIQQTAPNEKMFNLRGYFKQFDNIEEQIKINKIFRKSEHFLFEKILRGLFLYFATTELDQEGKDFINFVCDYFVMVMIAKDKNNKYIHAFEIDPTTLFDIIFEFFVVNSQTIFRMSNQSNMIVTAKKLINKVIDIIELFFDNNYEVIKHLEIIDIINKKFLNFCYTNDYHKKGVGLILIDILIKRFSKDITYKYLKDILRVVFSIASSYSSIIEIKNQNEYMTILNQLITMFVVEDEFKYLTPDIMDSNMDIDLEENVLNEKNKFTMMYYTLKYIMIELVNNLNSTSRYERKVCVYPIEKLLLIPKIKKISQFLFLLPEMSLTDFFKAYNNQPKEPSPEEAFALCLEYKCSINEHLQKNFNTIDYSLYSSLNDLNKPKLVEEKISYLMLSLTNRLGMTESNFTPLVANSAGLIFILTYCPELFVEYVFKNQSHIELLLDKVLKNLYETLLIDIFIYMEVNRYIQIGFFYPRFKNIFTEKLYIDKNLHLEFSIGTGECKTIITDENAAQYMEQIAKHVHKQEKKSEEYSVNDTYVSELFPVYDEKMTMLTNYLKILGMIFSNQEIYKKLTEKENDNKTKYSELKQKCTKLLITYIRHREEVKILNGCSKCLYAITSTDPNKDSLLNDEDLINTKTEKLNQSPKITNIIRLMDSFLIFAKSSPENEKFEHFFIRKLDDFKTDEINDHSILLFYIFISTFKYFREEVLKSKKDEIFELFYLKEKEICINHDLTSFTLTKYKNKIIKLFIRLKEGFFENLKQECEKEEKLKFYIIDLYSKIINDNKAYPIREYFGKELIVSIENSTKNKNLISTKNLLKLLYILAKKSPSVLKNELFLSYLINQYQYCNKANELDTDRLSNKIRKYISNIIQIYIQTYNASIHFIFDLFYYFSKTSNINHKNKIQLFSLVKIYQNKNEGKFKKIMHNFIAMYDSLLSKKDYFDSVVKYLIIPLFIKYLKDTLHFLNPNLQLEISPEEQSRQQLFNISLMKNLTQKLMGGIHYGKELSLREREKIIIEKQKLISLVISLNKYEYNRFKQKNPNGNLTELDEILKNINQMLYKSTSENNNSSKIYIMLNLSLFYKANDFQFEKSLEKVTVFYKNIPDEYSTISLLSYELIFPLAKDAQEFARTIVSLKDKCSLNQQFQIFSLFLKFPNVMDGLPGSVIKTLSTFIEKGILFGYPRKTIIQLLGLITAYYAREKSKPNPIESEEFFNELEKTLWNQLFGKLLLNKVENDSSNLQAILTYLKQLLEISKIDTPIIEFKFERQNPKMNSLYVCLFKFYIYYAKRDLLYKHYEHDFKLIDCMGENNNNYSSEMGFVMRALLDEQVLNKINNKDPLPIERMYEYKMKIFNLINNKYNSENKKKIKLCELNFEETVMNNSQLEEIGKKIINAFGGKTTIIFPHHEFKVFILYKKFIDSLNGKSSFNKISSITDSTFLLSNNQNLKDIYDNVYNNINEIMKNYLENFYWLTFKKYLDLKKTIDSQNKKDTKNKQFQTKEVQELFQTTKFFYPNLRSLEDIGNTKPNIDQFDSLSKEKEIHNDYDTILCGFNLFFTSKEIMEKYSDRLIELFISMYSVLKDKIFHSIFEDLIYILLNSAQLKLTQKSKLLYKIFSYTDFINDELNPGLINITCNFLEKHANETPKSSKLDKFINDALRIMIYASHNSDINIRQRLFKIFQKFHGRNLIDLLKWIFTFSLTESKASEFGSLWIPVSVDLILAYFDWKMPISTEDSSLPHLHNLTYDQNNNNNEDIIIDNDSNIDKENDKNGKIKENIDKFNKFISEKKSDTLLHSIRDIILIESTFSQKIWFFLFPQLWEMLSKTDREILTEYINDFLYELNNLVRHFGMIKIIIETFSNCYPIVKIAPEFLLSLTHTQNSWTGSFFYLENLFINNIDRERSYHCLIRILDILQEDQHANGLKQFMTQNDFSIAATANLQCRNYLKAEEILSKTFEVYKQHIDKHDISYENNQMLTQDPNEDEYLNEFSNKVDFCIWQNSLIECYKFTDKWPQVVGLSEETNDLNLTVEGMWHSGSDRWKDLNLKVQNRCSQYPARINQIYMMMNINQNNSETTYQQKCMNCIRAIYQDFLNFPPNFEKLNYYYFLIFQLIVEAWESTNTLKEAEKNVDEKKPSDFRENYETWRDRLPHVCEGYQTLKAILEPRNYLFDFLKKLIDETYQKEDAKINYLKVSDKIWNLLMFIKYARKLELHEVFFENLQKFDNEFQNLHNILPHINFLKHMEEMKYIKKVSFNFEKGIELSKNYIKELQDMMDTDEIREIRNDIQASYYYQQAYFLYKQSKIMEANDYFKKAAALNPTDYHIYYNWAEMCEEVTLNIKGEPAYETVWFENTISNYLMIMIYKIDKSKFIILRLFSMIKEFENQKLSNKFDKHLEFIVPWVWLFWIPSLFDHFKQTIEDDRNEFYFKILKKIAVNYPQSIYYPLTIIEHLNANTQNSSHLQLGNKLKELMGIIIQRDKLSGILRKIDIMINEISLKLERSFEETLLKSLNAFYVQSANDVNEVVRKLNKYIELLEKSPSIPLIKKLIEDLSQLTKNPHSLTIFMIFEKLKQFRYYLHSKLVTENHYEELQNVLESKLYNTNFEGVEIPGLYSNKFVEPTSENRICISRFESEYNSKFLIFLNKTLLIRGTNDKIYNFTLAKQSYLDSNDPKTTLLQCLLNEIFIKNKDTYQQKIKFNTPIRYFITYNTKIVQEETSQYYLNEVYEFCMQKLGYDPELAYTLYEDELSKLNGNYQSFNSHEIKEKVYNKMIKLVPVNSLKGFIHKFIVSGDDIFIFRKQFATTYGLNSLLGYLFSELITLNKISFNKDTGACTFHDFRCIFSDLSKYALEKKREVQIRLSKNISYFLTPSCLYGVIPSIMYAVTTAITKKDALMRKILACIKLNISGSYSKEDMKESEGYINVFMRKVNLIRNTDNENDQGEHPLRVILEVINGAMNDDLLKKMPLSWEPWF